MTDASTRQLPKVLQKLLDIRAYISTQIFERDAETDSSFQALLSGESCLFIGDAGTAKSFQINLIAEFTGLSLFDTLMSETTKPDSVFGPVDVPALAKGVQRYKTKGYAPDAQLLFFDEIFKATGIVLNPLLWLLNERKFRNGDEGIIQTPTMCVFAASNEVPTDPTLRPVYDRFVIRHNVSYLKSHANMSRMFDNSLGKGTAADARPASLTPKEVIELRDMCAQVRVPEEVYQAMITTRDQVQRACTTLKISDRRMVKALRVVQANALMKGRGKARIADLEVLANIFWDSPDQSSKVRSICVSNADSGNADILSYGELAESFYEKAITTGEMEPQMIKLETLLRTTSKFSTNVGISIHNSIIEKFEQLRSTTEQRKHFVIIEIGDDVDAFFKVSEATSQLWAESMLREAGFKWRRVGYWWQPIIKRDKLTATIQKVMKVTPTFKTVI
jgi:MoxR-like ATPase